MIDNVTRILMHLCLSMVLTTSSIACDDDEDDRDNLSQEDKDVMVRAGYTNEAEIGLGKLALSKAEEQSMFDFAQQMVTAHTTAWNVLDEIGDDHDASVPDEMDNEHKIYAVPEGLFGYKVDNAYMHHHVVDHQKPEALFAAHHTEAKAEDIRAYAPIQMGLQMRRVSVLKLHRSNSSNSSF